MDSNRIEPSSDINQALVYLKSVNYGRTYTVKMTSKDGSVHPDASHSTIQQVTDTTAGNGDDHEINSNALKVSSVMTTTRDSRTCLRDGIETELGGGVDIHDFQRAVTHSDNFNYTHLYASTGDEITVNATDAADGQYVVTLEGASVPYNTVSNPDRFTANGWWIINSDTIAFPNYLIVSQPHTQNNFLLTRPAGRIVHLPNGVQDHGYVTPTTANDEPYFIINTPKDSGGVRDFDIQVTDDDGGVNLKAFKGNAKSFTDLPNQCENGIRLGVVGDNQKKEDDFHVVFTGEAGSGYWKETVAYNLENYYDKSTMPHTLRQNADLSFTFAEGEWDERKAGDDNTNPAPSFVSGDQPSYISDIFFHRNRLGILSGENVIFSEAGNEFNFWRTTVRTLLDSDPIDVAVSQNEVSELKAAVPIQDNLLLFSNLNQFTLSASQLLTPAEVTVDQSTKYECDLTATPVGAGTSVFFATKSGRYAGVREFFTKDDTEIKDATDITAHVPKYLDGNIRHLAASSNEDTLVALTSSNKNECYVYKWYNSTQERLQSSWSKWIFFSGDQPKNIASIFFNNAKLFFTFEDGSYEEMDLSEPDPVLLDTQIQIHGSHTDAELEHINTFPFTPTMQAITEEGYTLGTYDPNNLNQAILDYIDPNKTGGTLTIGEPYTFKYQMSEQVFKPVQGDSTKLARFQLRKMSFNFSNTGKFDVTVDSIGRDLSTKTFTGRILGEPENILGQAVVVPEGSFQVGVQSRPETTKITITNDTHLPSVFQSAEWEGFVVLRNQRL